MEIWRVVCRSFRERCEDTRTERTDIFSAFTEIGTRCFFYTIGIIAKRKRIEIHFEDFVFGVGFIELVREIHFLYLSLDRFFIRQECIFDQLL